MSALGERKLLELRQKLCALDAELERWRKDSEPNQSAQKHHSQVRAIIAVLTGLRETLHKRVEALAGTRRSSANRPTSRGSS
jgi:hypothetical protein